MAENGLGMEGRAMSLLQKAEGKLDRGLCVAVVERPFVEKMERSYMRGEGEVLEGEIQKLWSETVLWGGGRLCH